MDNLNTVLTEYTIYIDSSSLMHGSMEFFKISLLNVLQTKKRKIKIVDFVIKDLKRKQFTDNERYAVKALNVIEYYRKRGLVEDIISTKTENNSILDIIYNNRENDHNNVCVITENKDLANEIVTKLSDRNAVHFDHEIAAVRLINGPALWDIKTVKPRVMPIRGQRIETVPVEETVVIQPQNQTVQPPISNEPKTETIQPEPTPVQEPIPVAFEKTPIRPSRSKRDKLVVSLVVDNSSSITGERALKLKNSLQSFADKIAQSDFVNDLDLAVYGFDGFSPRVIKSFDGQFDPARFDMGGVQVLGKAIELAMDELVARQKEYKELPLETHKPWLIVLSDGDAYGETQTIANKLKNIVQTKKITYFPFSLSSYQIEDTLSPLAKLKTFLKIKEDRFEDLFDFLFNTLNTRIHTPKDDPMTLDRQAIQGFIAR